MNSLTISLISFACIFGGALFGIVLRQVLPAHHLREDSKDTVKLGAGLIATLAALVLGLLVGSAKNTFDTVSEGITHGAAKVIVLDRILARYGPPTQAAREHLRRHVAAGIETLWPDQPTGVSGLTVLERANGVELMQDKIRALEPADEVQRALKAQALNLSSDLMLSRWLVIEQAQNSLPMPLLVVLIFWLTMLYASIGLFAPANGTVISMLCVCALSASAAIFLIREMNRPLDGVIKVSRAPMVKALEHLGRP